MSERGLSDAELERALRDVGAHLAYPPTADLLPAVRSRIERGRTPSFWATFWSPRLAFVPAVATAAVLLVATLAFQPVGAKAAEALGLRGLAIFFGLEAPAASAAGKAILPDATRVASLEAASREVGFTVRAPTSAVGAPPDEIYVRHAGGQTQAILLYREGAGGIARSSTVPGVGMLIVEARGKVEQPLLGKVIPAGTRVEQVTVNGGPGIWIEGEPHQFFYRAPDGNVVIDSVRLAGNVLAWEQDGLLLRVESQVDRATALKIAAAMP